MVVLLLALVLPQRQHQRLVRLLCCAASLLLLLQRQLAPLQAVKLGGLLQQPLLSLDVLGPLLLSALQLPALQHPALRRPAQLCKPASWAGQALLSLLLHDQLRSRPRFPSHWKGRSNLHLPPQWAGLSCRPSSPQVQLRSLACHSRHWMCVLRHLQVERGQQEGQGVQTRAHSRGLLRAARPAKPESTMACGSALYWGCNAPGAGNG